MTIEHKGADKELLIESKIRWDWFDKNCEQAKQD